LAQLTDKQHAAVDRWWSTLADKAASEKPGGPAPARKALVREFNACGFSSGFSCVSWGELRTLLPNVAEALGQSIITRHRLRA
jgi:hypothetical protein